VQIVCRDRGGAYAEGAAHGAPDTAQVADRWHLMHDLSEAVHKVVTRRRRCLQQPPATSGDEPAALTAPRPAAPGRRAANTRSRHAAVHALLADGLTLTTIMQRLGMSRGTVRKYASSSPAASTICAQCSRSSCTLAADAREEVGLTYATGPAHDHATAHNQGRRALSGTPTAGRRQRR
jgi:DNA-binding CsgD family transcriptional regulator